MRSWELRRNYLLQSALAQMRRNAASKSHSPTGLSSDGISPSKSASSGGSPKDVFFMEQSQYKASTTPTKTQNDSGEAYGTVVQCFGEIVIFAHWCALILYSSFNGMYFSLPQVSLSSRL